MEQKIDMIVNRLPAKTWNRLSVNQAEIKNLEANGWQRPAVTVRYPKDEKPIVRELTTEQESSVYKKMEQIRTGMGAEVSRLKPGDATDICVETVEEGGESDERRERMRRDEVVLVLDYPDRKNCFQDVKIYAKAGESVTVWTVVRSKKDAEGKAVLRTLLQAEENAKIRLVQVDLLGDRMQLFNDIGVESGKQAQIEVMQLFLGAEKIWAGSYAALTGEKSHLQLDAGYYREKQQLLDMNYVAQHIGKKTESNMNVGGVLQDASKKVFRGTIDFPLGCVGAKGDEMEDVLILGEDAINQTVPLILCAEEDVEGNHGASIGRPADEILFYLASRGLSEEDACNLLARAKLEALCNRIGEKEIAEQAENWLWEVTGDEA